MKILFIGGNGNISWWCVRNSKKLGYEITVLTRGITIKSRRERIEGVKYVDLDANNAESINNFLEIKGNCFDIVCDFICYDEYQAKSRYKIFEGRVKQYIFVSSVVVYSRKTKYLPFKESTPRWRSTEYKYANDKIKAEEVFINAYSKNGFPVTIVRPAHTYDTVVPIPLGHNCFTMPYRLIQGKPLLIPGDGTNLWTLTHSSDFADAFCALIGNPYAIGEDFHITGDEWNTWLDIGRKILSALELLNNRVIHIPITEISSMNIPVTKNMSISYFGSSYFGQRMWCDVYDNSKIKKITTSWNQKILFEEGIRKTFEWLRADEHRMRYNEDLNAILEDLTLRYSSNEIGIPFDIS